MIKKIKSLEFYIGGFFGSASKIAITDKDVKYIHSDSSFITDEIGILSNLSESDIEELIGVMNNIKVSEWKDEYVNESVLDGTQWSLDIEYNNIKKKSIYGSNCYPGEKGNCSGFYENDINDEDDYSFSPEFDILLKAFDKLIKTDLFYSLEDE